MGRYQSRARTVAVFLSSPVSGLNLYYFYYLFYCVPYGSTDTSSLCAMTRCPPVHRRAHRQRTCSLPVPISFATTLILPSHPARTILVLQTVTSDGTHVSRRSSDQPATLHPTLSRKVASSTSLSDTTLALLLKPN
jgi:hypothetical protein